MTQARGPQVVWKQKNQSINMTTVATCIEYDICDVPRVVNPPMTIIHAQRSAAPPSMTLRRPDRSAVNMLNRFATTPITYTTTDISSTSRNPIWERKTAW